MNSYYTADYISCNNWALIDSKVSEYHLQNVSNSFSGSYMISFANGIPTAEERRQIEQSLTDKFTGENNAGKFILTFSDDKTRVPEITPISPADLDKQYIALNEMTVSSILAGHRVTSKTLMGLDSANGFSSNAAELLNASNFFQNTVISPFQGQILKVLHKIFQVNNMDMPVQFVQLKPITIQFDSETIRDVMTQDEIREEIGLPPLEGEVAEDFKQDFAKVGMIDGKPVFDTIDEALASAKTLGCEGYHEHELEGKTVYMACEGHNQATELSKFIEEFGEDMPDDWELVDEEVVDGEHNDFDFEQVLNEEADKNLELASAVSATPNKRSSQDGVNKSYNDYYKVRYVYATDNFLTNKSGTSREFCRDMVAAKKIYTKEDLKDANSLVLNKGFGEGGTKKYNIFLYKGGPQCRHFFLRRIYKTSLRGAKSKISSSQLISYTKARSEGFTAEKNDKLVAIAPQRMKNNGYKNPR